MPLPLYGWAACCGTCCLAFAGQRQAEQAEPRAAAGHDERIHLHVTTGFTAVLETESRKGGLARGLQVRGGLPCSEANGETCFYFPVLKMYFGTFCRALRPPPLPPSPPPPPSHPPCACCGTSVGPRLQDHRFLTEKSPRFQLEHMLSYRLALLGALVATVLSSPSEPAHRTFVAHARMGKQGRLGNQMFQW